MIDQPQWVWFLEAITLIFLVVAGLRYGWLKTPYKRDNSSNTDGVEYAHYDPYNQLESNNKQKVIEMRKK